MKVLPFQIPKPTNDALIYQEDREIAFYGQLHQHEEIQLSYIVNGEGTLLVGDTISSYKSGDIFAIGSNLPHVFQSDSNLAEESVMLTLFFTKKSFGDDFFELEELKETSSFFRHIETGFKIVSQQKLFEEKFTVLFNQTKLQRFVSLLEILKLMGKAKKESLSSYHYKKSFSDNEGKRMREVIDFTLNNYNESITLEKIADVASMSKNAFCKYFKKRTNKTYVQFLNELRIERACKLLVETECTISEVAFQVGFGNLSNFNRKFKEVKVKTPTEFKKTFRLRSR